MSKITSLSIRSFAIIFILLLLNNNFVFTQKHEGVALTPPMGWNSWNCFHENISEEKIKSIADAMVSSGMKDAGYEYVVIDDGWMTDSRDENGHIIVDSVKFPNGIKALADYVHSLGLKFGIYSAPGRYTCQKLMGSLGYEQIDADTYASWGVDFLKYDWCSYPSTRDVAMKTPERDCRQAFELMRDCLYRTGRPIVYSIHDICLNKVENLNSFPWVKEVGHMHRTSNDIKDNWERMLYCLETTVDYAEYAGPGYWNDLDMLEVGNEVQERVWGGISTKKMNLTEYRTHFILWCMAASPLMAGNDLRTMKQEINEILTHKELIAINQDMLGKQARRIVKEGNIEIWLKDLSGGRKAIALVNMGEQPEDITFSWEDIGMQGKLKLRDVWEGKKLGKYRDTYTGKDIPGHGAVVMEVKR